MEPREDVNRRRFNGIISLDPKLYFTEIRASDRAWRPEVLVKRIKESVFLSVTCPRSASQRKNRENIPGEAKQS